MGRKKRNAGNGPHPDAFPTQLRKWRMRRGLGDAMSLARRMGVPASTITRLERGERRPSLDILCRIATALDVPLDFLVRTTSRDAWKVLQQRDRRELERLRTKFHTMMASSGPNLRTENVTLAKELDLWLEHLSEILYQRLSPGDGKSPGRRSSSA